MRARILARRDWRVEYRRSFFCCFSITTFQLLFFCGLEARRFAGRRESGGSSGLEFFDVFSD